MIGEPQEITLPTGATVDVAEMDGFEVSRADAVLSSLVGNGGGNGEIPVMAIALQQLKVYAICSVRKLNGEPYVPLRSIAEYSSIAKRLSYRDIQALQAWAYPRYSPPEDEIKKEPTAEE